MAGSSRMDPERQAARVSDELLALTAERQELAQERDRLQRALNEAQDRNAETDLTLASLQQHLKSGLDTKLEPTPGRVTSSNLQRALSMRGAPRRPRFLFRDQGRSAAIVNALDSAYHVLYQKRNPRSGGECGACDPKQKQPAALA